MSTAPPHIANEYRRTARRLFGVRSENYEVPDHMPALLYAQNLREHEGLSNEDAALVAMQVFPAADRNELDKMLASSAGATKGAR